jgi:hypothetical protein
MIINLQALDLQDFSLSQSIAFYTNLEKSFISKIKHIQLILTYVLKSLHYKDIGLLSSDMV